LADDNIACRIWNRIRTPVACGAPRSAAGANPTYRAQEEALLQRLNAGADQSSNLSMPLLIRRLSQHDLFFLGTPACLFAGMQKLDRGAATETNEAADFAKVEGC
jgi:hypothetical protein